MARDFSRTHASMRPRRIRRGRQRITCPMVIDPHRFNEAAANSPRKEERAKARLEKAVELQ